MIIKYLNTFPKKNRKVILLVFFKNIRNEYLQK